MKHTVSLFRTAITLWPLAAAALSLAAQQALPKRNFQPEDLFHVRQVGGVTWSADGLHAAIELTRPDRALGSGVERDGIARREKPRASHSELECAQIRWFL